MQLRAVLGDLTAADVDVVVSVEVEHVAEVRFVLFSPDVLAAFEGALSG